MKENLWLTLVTCLAYCVDKELWKAIDYPTDQTRVLKEQQEKDKRILLNDLQRIRLAAKAKSLTRELLEATTILFTPETVLGWYRKLIAQKYDGSENCKNPGRPRISQEIIDLVIRFKKDNPHWGYTRIRDYIEKRKHIRPMRHMPFRQGFKGPRSRPGRSFSHPAGTIQSIPVGLVFIITPRLLVLSDLSQQQGPAIVTAAALKIDYVPANSLPQDGPIVA